MRRATRRLLLLSLGAVAVPLVPFLLCGGRLARFDAEDHAAPARRQRQLGPLLVVVPRPLPTE